MIYTYAVTPIGALVAARDSDGIAVISFPMDGRPADPRAESGAER